MAKIIVQPGEKYAYLTIVKEVDSRIDSKGSAIRRFECLCDCGKTTCVNLADLRHKNTFSCGCHRASFKGAGSPTYKHGLRRSKEYDTYYKMIGRCYTPSNPKFKDYGERGIRVCDRWLGKDGVINFFLDMGPCPSSKNSIDRIDNSGNYCLENCRWSDPKEQSNNRRSNVLITVNEITATLTQWSKKNGPHRKTIRSRLNRGWCPACAVTIKGKSGTCHHVAIEGCTPSQNL